MKCWKVIFVLLIVAASAAKAEIVGKARVIDGATLEVGVHTVRLYAIDAPTEAQNCTEGGKTWPCGREASFALAYQVGDHWLTCEEKGRDREDRVLALCRVGGKDLGRLMVAQGWALADRRFGSGYVADEVRARAARAGTWRGDLVAPKSSGWQSLADLAKSKGGSPTDHPLCVLGVVEAGGIECPAFRGTDGGLYALLGDFGRPDPGMEICVCGAIAAVSHCMRGTALSVAWRGRPEECPAGKGR
jgi:endonuclease YncB( thermonuclease family)